MHTRNLAVRFRQVCSVTPVGTKSVQLSGWCFSFFSVSPYGMTACCGSKGSQDSARLDLGA